ncbi:MAG TPA: LacI family DNA-binding transcriptional regulator [Clostridia bacterium]|nr:LacI family DNA-binding transcriptional regulator [Clostridia bacterium]
MEHLTIKDIARLSGTSVSTVSRVLNNHPDVSAAVRAKVLEVVGVNHFVPNNSARSLVIRESDLIAVIVRGVGNPFFSTLIETMEYAIDSYGYTMALHQIKSSADELKAAAQLEREKRLKGILFLGGRFNYLPGELASIKVPFVCCTYTNAFGALDAGKYSSVAIDDRLEARRAVDYLVGKGHRRIGALIERTDGGSISQLRYEGYVNALAAHGIPFDPALVAAAGSFDMADAYRAAGKLLDEAKPAALFAISDSMAMAALKAAADAGLSVPGDLSVIAIDGLEQSKYCVPTLTTLEQPADELARRSVDILAGLLGGDAEHGHVFMETRLREGGSVRQI